MENCFYLFKKNGDIWKFSYDFYTFELNEEICLIKRIVDYKIVKTYKTEEIIINP